MANPELIQLFPNPILILKYPNDFSEELEFVKNLQYRGKGIGEYQGDSLNRQSMETFLFDLPELKRIKDFCTASVEMFADQVLQTSDKLFITQCWSNITRKGERHHEHTHPNSIISGVFYFQNNSKLPPIRFRRDVNRELLLNHKVKNNFNSDIYMLSAESGELLLFLSTLEHSVLENKSEEDRISISFNTFTKGSIGSIEDLTYIPIDRCKE